MSASVLECASTACDFRRQISTWIYVSYCPIHSIVISIYLSLPSTPNESESLWTSFRILWQSCTNCWGTWTLGFLWSVDPPNGWRRPSPKSPRLMRKYSEKKNGIKTRYSNWRWYPSELTIWLRALSICNTSRIFSSRSVSRTLWASSTWALACSGSAPRSEVGPWLTDRLPLLSLALPPAAEANCCLRMSSSSKTFLSSRHWACVAVNLALSASISPRNRPMVSLVGRP